MCYADYPKCGLSWESDGAGVPTLFVDAADLSYRSDAFAMATPRSSSAEPAAFSVIVSDVTTSPVDDRGACISQADTHAQLNAEIVAGCSFCCALTRLAATC